jgi:hypothetical protein
VSVPSQRERSALDRIDKRIIEIELELPNVRKRITSDHRYRNELTNERYGLVKMKELLNGADGDESS